MECVIAKKLRHRPTGRLNFWRCYGFGYISSYYSIDLVSGWRKKAKCSGRALFSWVLLKWKENMLARSCVKRYEIFSLIIFEYLVLIIPLLFFSAPGSHG